MTSCVPLCSCRPASIVDAPLADHAEAVVREAVSKLSGTPAPPPLSINVNVEDELSIEVIDNGRGISGDITGSGLVKLRERARDAGGSFAIEPAPSGGTVLRWSAPLPGRTFDFVHWDQRPW